MHRNRDTGTETETGSHRNRDGQKGRQVGTKTEMGR